MLSARFTSTYHPQPPGGLCQKAIKIARLYDLRFNSIQYNRQDWILYFNLSSLLMVIFCNWLKSDSKTVIWLTKLHNSAQNVSAFISVRLVWSNMQLLSNVIFLLRFDQIQTYVQLLVLIKLLLALSANKNNFDSATFSNHLEFWWSL